MSERIASWVILQYWSYGNKLVRWVPPKWRTHGFDKNRAYRSDTTQAKRENITKNRRLPELLAGLQAIPWDKIHWAGTDLGKDLWIARRAGETVKVLIDPDYEGTTSSYGVKFPRGEVLYAASRWAQSGALVGVHEAVPLCAQLAAPGMPWRSIKLGSGKGRGRTFSLQQEEWLTVNF